MLTGPDGPFVPNARRDRQGVVRIPGIPAGTYRIRISASGYSVAERDVEICDGEETWIEDVLLPAGSLRWVIRAADGAPLAGVECRLVPEDPNSIEPPRQGRTDAQGHWAASGLAPGICIATATTNGNSISTRFTITPKGHDEKKSVLN